MVVNVLTPKSKLAIVAPMSSSGKRSVQLMPVIHGDQERRVERDPVVRRVEFRNGRRTPAGDRDWREDWIGDGMLSSAIGAMRAFWADAEPRSRGRWSESGVGR